MSGGLRYDFQEKEDRAATTDDIPIDQHTFAEACEFLRTSIVGHDLSIRTPFGYRHLCYADYTASGRSLEPIENFITSHVLPYYGNTHTLANATASQSTFYRIEARQIIKQQLNATHDDALIFCGAGCTAAITKFLLIMNKSFWCIPTHSKVKRIDGKGRELPVTYSGGTDPYLREDRWGSCECTLCGIRVKSELAYRSHTHSEGHQQRLQKIAADESTTTTKQDVPEKATLSHEGSMSSTTSTVTGSTVTTSIYRLIVFICDPTAHHSLLLPFRELVNMGGLIKNTPPKVVVQFDSVDLLLDNEKCCLDVAHLEEELQRCKALEQHILNTFNTKEKFSPRIEVIPVAVLSAASNITGLTHDVKNINALVHRYQGLCCWDFATAAGHMCIDFNPAMDPDGFIDAGFFSPHKLLGGPGSSGNALNKDTPLVVPSAPGGGVVFFVSKEKHSYIHNTEEREEGGTPNIIADIRSGLVYRLFTTIPFKLTTAREEGMVAYLLRHWTLHKRIHILGPHFENNEPCSEGRLPIISFMIRYGNNTEHNTDTSVRTGLYLHHQFVVALLNDLFGIQARGGCACAGPFAQTLLGLSSSRTLEIERALERSGQEILRPGFVRISLNFSMSWDDVDIICQAVMWVADFGWQFLPSYSFTAETGEWKHRSFELKDVRKWLSTFTLKPLEAKTNIINTSKQNSSLNLSPLSRQQSSTKDPKRVAGAVSLLGDNADGQQLKMDIQKALAGLKKTGESSISKPRASPESTSELEAVWKRRATSGLTKKPNDTQEILKKSKLLLENSTDLMNSDVSYCNSWTGSETPNRRMSTGELNETRLAKSSPPETLQNSNTPQNKGQKHVNKEGHSPSGFFNVLRKKTVEKKKKNELPSTDEKRRLSTPILKPAGTYLGRNPSEEQTSNEPRTPKTNKSTPVNNSVSPISSTDSPAELSSPKNQSLCSSPFSRQQQNHHSDVKSPLLLNVRRNTAALPKQQYLSPQKGTTEEAPRRHSLSPKYERIQLNKSQQEECMETPDENNHQPTSDAFPLTLETLDENNYQAASDDPFPLGMETPLDLELLLEYSDKTLKFLYENATFKTYLKTAESQYLCTVPLEYIHLVWFALPCDAAQSLLRYLSTGRETDKYPTVMAIPKSLVMKGVIRPTTSCFIVPQFSIDPNASNDPTKKLILPVPSSLSKHNKGEHSTDTSFVASFQSVAETIFKDAQDKTTKSHFDTQNDFKTLHILKGALVANRLYVSEQKAKKLEDDKENITENENDVDIREKPCSLLDFVEEDRKQLQEQFKNNSGTAINNASSFIKIPRNLRHLVGSAIREFNMIREGDRLLLGLSGGKDSLSLLHILRDAQRRSPIKFQLAAATVDPQTPEYNPKPLAAYMQALGIRYHLLSYPIIELAKTHMQKNSICAFCSRMKRGLLYSCMRKSNYNVLVLGQHLDDICESFFMSAFHNGSLNTMKANYVIGRGDIRVCRPLVFTREKLLATFAAQHRLPVIADNCPACFSEPKERHRTKLLLAQQEFEHPHVFQNLLQTVKPLMSITTVETKAPSPTEHLEDAIFAEQLLASKGFDLHRLPDTAATTENNDFDAEQVLTACFNGSCSRKNN